MIKMNKILNPENIAKGNFVKFPYTKPGVISVEEMYEVMDIVGNKITVMGDDGVKVHYPINKVKKVEI